MNLSLAIETSSARYAIALGAGEDVVFDSARDLHGDTSRDLSDLLERALAAACARVGEITTILVNVGPGSLGSLRDGVAFANGLAYALERPVFTFTTFELLGRLAWRDSPVLCTRRANEGLAYAGVFDGATVGRMRFGRLEDIVPLVAGGQKRFTAAGSFHAETAALLPDARVADSCLDTPTAAIMLQIGVAGRAQVTAAAPLNERSAIFHD